MVFGCSRRDPSASLYASEKAATSRNSIDVTGGGVRVTGAARPGPVAESAGPQGCTGPNWNKALVKSVDGNIWFLKQNSPDRNDVHWLGHPIHAT